jgi:hypothetical protein
LLASTLRQVEAGTIARDQARLIFQGAKALLEAIDRVEKLDEVERKLDAHLAVCPSTRRQSA